MFGDQNRTIWYSLCRLLNFTSEKYNRLQRCFDRKWHSETSFCSVRNSVLVGFAAFRQQLLSSSLTSSIFLRRLARRVVGIKKRRMKSAINAYDVVLHLNFHCILPNEKNMSRVYQSIN